MDNKYSFQVKNFIFIALGAAIYAFGFVVFKMPNQIADSGMAGVTLILHALFGINPTITGYLINLLLIILGAKLFGRNAVIYTLHGTVMLYLFIWLWQLSGIPFVLTSIYLLSGGVATDPGLAIPILISLIGLVMLIVKNLAYMQAEMILFDRIDSGQEHDTFDIIKESKTLMTGKKLDFMIFQLSFLGWYILVVYVVPYHLRADAVFYDNLKK